MRTNNRQPVYQEKVLEKRKVFHREVKDGVSIFVEGSKPNPYKDVPCESLKLKSRIDSGVFESHEGAVRKLEKANGSDVAQKQIEDAQREFNVRKENNQRKLTEKKIKEFVDKSINDSSKD